MVLPVSGWFFSLLPLGISGHFGNFSSDAGLNQSNHAAIIAFFVAAAMDGVIGTTGIVLARSARRKTRASYGYEVRNGWTTAGWVLSMILIAFGVMMLAIGLFLNAANTEWNF